MKKLKTSVFLCLVIFIMPSLLSAASSTQKNHKNAVINDISDIKDLKKLFRTKTNLLLMFVSSVKEAQPAVKVFREAADAIKGVGTLVLIDCSSQDKKKLCKKLKVAPEPYVLKHYKDGDFHKDYNRQIMVNSMINFMRDPTGDLPWEEDPAGADVTHISSANGLVKLLAKETKPLLVMFYAPWCGYCKQLKPEYSAAATASKGRFAFAAINVDRPENSVTRHLYNITGFPTMLYFENGHKLYTYEGENKKDALIAFMESPTAPPVAKTKEADWSADPNSEIVHLTTTGFEPALKDEKSVLVMFYAPWCGHCKRMKPEYEKAALLMQSKNIPGILAALDATKESSIGQKYNVKGYPTVKYFVNGEFKFDVNVRDAEKIVSFMKDPIEPPPPPPPEAHWSEEESEVEHLNEETFKPFLKKKKHALVMFYAPWCGHCKKAKPEFASAAETFKEDPRVALAAVDCTRHSAVCSVYEVRGYPTIKYFSYLKTKLDYNGGRTTSDFVKFLNNPDEANTNVKTSEPFGTFPGSDKLLLLDDNTFENEAKNIKKLLVMFYAPWCGHCKRMKPDLAEAAGQVGGQYRFAAVDCDVNHKVAEKYKVKGFPTLMLFEKGKFISNYDGPRKAEHMVKFLKGDSRASNNIKDEL